MRQSKDMIDGHASDSIDNRKTTSFKVLNVTDITTEFQRL